MRYVDFVKRAGLGNYKTKKETAENLNIGIKV